MAQQDTLLRREGRKLGTEVACAQDLERFITRQREMHNEIILLIDANEEFIIDSGIRQLATSTGLKNVMYEIHGSTPPTKPSTGRVIDFILCTENVLHSITNACLVPYFLEMGDHRGMIIDINTETLLNTCEREAGGNKARRLDTRNVKATKAYLDTLEESLGQHNVIERVRRLKDLVSDFKGGRRGSKEEIVTLYDKIDSDVFRLCRHAESKCRKLPSNSVCFSPVVTTMRNQQYILEAIKRRLKKGKEIDPHYTATARTADLNIDIGDINVVEDKLKGIYDFFSKESDTSGQHRHNFLQARAEKYAQENKMSSAKAVEEILKHERIRTTFRYMATQLRPNQRSQLRRIWVRRRNAADGTEERHEIHDTSEMEATILERNRRHLQQARKTPFADSVLGRLLKMDGMGDIADEILMGGNNYDKPTEEWLQHYIKHMAVGDIETLETVNPMITEEEYKKFWRKKRESTATSPFGLHVGHYKAAVESSTLVKIQRYLMVLPFEMGFVPIRWRRTVQLMLEKDPGRPWLHRLRIIELFDAQLNAALQIIVGRKMVYNALKRKLLHPAAFGSVPGKTAPSAVLHKLLQIENLRLNKKSGALFECDATGCYDRILPSLQGIHTRRLGLSKNTAKVVSESLIKSNRHVGTRHGTSKDSYISTEEEPLYGIGQGSGAGPAIWLAHLVVMLHALADKCNGITSCNPEKTMVHKSNGNGYVDDCNIMVQVDSAEAREEEVLHNLRHDAQWWERCLFSNGGKLELSKCFLFCFLWKWVAGAAKLKKMSNNGRTLELIQSEDQTIARVTQKCVTDPMKVLGVYMSTDGSWVRERRRWQETANEFAGKVKRPRMNREECGDIAYKTLWVPKLRYVAGLVDFNVKQCKRIQSKVLASTLATAGYNQKFPRLVVKRYNFLQV